MPRRFLGLYPISWGIVLPSLALLAIGLITIHATERVESQAHLLEREEQFHDVTLVDRVIAWVGPSTVKQTLFALGGVVLALLMMWPSYLRMGPWAYSTYWIIIGLLALLVIDHVIDLPFVPVRRDTRRWVGFGPFVIQPSEFAKLSLVFVLAWYLRFRESYRTWWGLIPPFLMTLLPMVLILKQPDLGTLLMLLPTLFAMLFVAGARLRHLALIIGAGIAVAPLFYMFGMKEYQRQRIDVVIRQETSDQRWHMGPGYQLRQAKTALGLGGVWGAGFGEGVFARFELLPEEHNDFIFAFIGNQWGLVGCSVVIGLYCILLIFSLEVAALTQEPYGRLLAVGIAVKIVVQALLNICMVIGLAPITGMPLPLISAGGSSLWMTALGLGLLLNVAQRRPMVIGKPAFEFKDS